MIVHLLILTWYSGMLLMHMVAMDVSTTPMETRLKSLLGMEYPGFSSVSHRHFLMFP